MDNAADLKEKARTLESGGQDQAALDLYLQIVGGAAEPDPAVLVRVGNLQLRLGRAEEAASSFARCAELLMEAGLLNGAIALWRRVLHIEPDSPDVLLRLAELNAREGYAGEAREALSRFVERAERAGEPAPALEALRSHLRAFPDDDAVRRLLVERLEAHGLAGEAPEVASAASPEAPAGAGAVETAPEPSPDLEVVGSGWEGADLAGAVEVPPDEIDLVRTRIEEEAVPTEGEIAPLAGLEPTLLEGLEPTSLEPEPAREEPRADEEEPLALLGSEPEAERRGGAPPEELADGAELPEDGGDDLPLLGGSEAPDPPVDAHARLMRRVEAAVRAGEPGGIAAALLDLGRHLAAAGQSERAREVFERLLEMDPGNEEGRRALDALRPG